MDFTPHAYQTQAVDWLLERTDPTGGAALFLDPGLGKTAITLTWLQSLAREGKRRAALVVAPLRVWCSGWPQVLE